MPASAYALLATFAAVSAGAGVVAARVVGPPRAWTMAVPGMAAFGALYLVGHRWALSPGPQVELFGYDVALPFDLAVALGAAFGAAAVQRLGLRLLDAEQDHAGRDGLA